jgi:hypothetical protein
MLMLTRRLLTQASFAAVAINLLLMKGVQAMPWTEILSGITSTVDVIGKLAKNVQDAVASGASIYDSIKLHNLHSDLTDTLGTFNGVNSLKRLNIRDLTDYLAKDPTAPKWSIIQSEWREIAAKLQTVLATIKGQDTAMVQGAGLENASDLGAALDQQARIYQQLPDMTEPATSADRDILSRILSKLKDLVDEVIKLEGSIETYLQQHPPPQ